MARLPGGRPYPSGGDWICKVRHRSAGEDVRVMAALAIDDNGNKVIVVTTYG
jgi:hypothetical protein